MRMILLLISAMMWSCYVESPAQAVAPEDLQYIDVYEYHAHFTAVAMRMVVTNPDGVRDTTHKSKGYKYIGKGLVWYVEGSRIGSNKKIAHSYHIDTSGCRIDTVGDTIYTRLLPFRRVL